MPSRKLLPRLRPIEKPILSYQKSVKGIVKWLFKGAAAKVLPDYKALWQEKEKSNVRADADIFSLSFLLQRVLAQNEEAVKEEVSALAQQYGLEMAERHRADFLSKATAVLGVNLLLAEPYMKGVMQDFALRNASYINETIRKMFVGLEELMFNAWSVGANPVDLADQLSGRYEIAARHAQLIARDQMQKLNASLTEYRQKEIGVTHYVWRTALDERVRDSHRANEGKTFAWNAPPPTGHVGTAVNCRCFAQAILDGVVQKL